LREAQISANKYLEDAKAAKSILSSSEQSWKLQADSINQELADIRSRSVLRNGSYRATLTRG
jgi:hypothetical protein